MASFFSSFNSFFAAQDDEQAALRALQELYMEDLEACIRDLRQTLADDGEGIVAGRSSAGSFEARGAGDLTPGVQRLLSCIESCFFHGLKTTSGGDWRADNPQLTVNFWALLQSCANESAAMGSLLGELEKQNSAATTHYGHCRAWLRFSMNKERQRGARALCSVSLREYYSDESILVSLADKFLMVLGSADAFRWSLIQPSCIFRVDEYCGGHVRSLSACDANTIYQPSGERDGVARYESRTGMEIFRSQVLTKTVRCSAKRWFLGNPNRKKCTTMLKLETSSTVPPFDEWIVHPETQLEPLLLTRVTWSG